MTVRHARVEPHAAAALRPGGTLRTLVAFGGERHAEAAVGLVEALARDHPLDVTVVSVARFHPVLCAWAPLSGMATCACLRDDAALAADALAREVVPSLPADAVVHHAVVLGWRSPVMLQPLEAGVYDALVLGGPAAPWRRAVARAAASSGTWVVVPTRVGAVAAG